MTANRRSLAAAATLPLLLIAGCGSRPAPAGAGSTGSSTPAPSSGAPSGPTSSASAVTTAPSTAGPAGGPVPAGFQPQSASFVSLDLGWVLGWAPCPHAPCAAVLRTTDGGTHWVGIPAPAENPLAAMNSADRIRFADPRDGWVWGNGLFATHDGGAHWTPVSLPGLTGEVHVAALAASAGWVDAVAGPVSGGHLSLYRAAASGGGWTAVPHITDAVAGGASLALHGDSGALVLPGEPTGGLYATTADGAHWTVRPNPCRSTGMSAAAVSAADNRHVAVVCSGGAAAGSMPKTVVASSDGGLTFVRVGSAPSGGDLVGISLATASDYLISALSGASWLYRSVDGGSHWSTAVMAADGGLGFLDFGFTSAAQGCAVHGRPASPSTRLPASRMLMTHDGGAHWAPVTF